jgi:UPF0716 protein FxsA
MPLLILLFIALPILELLVIIEVARGIGVVPTLALLFLTGVVGAVLLRSQGRTAWQRFNLALADGRVPARETADGAMIIFGGALLVTPGFVTDAVGLALLAPPTRAMIRGGLGAMASRRIAFTWRMARRASRRSPSEARPPPSADAPSADGRGYDYEGTAREVTDSETELPRPPSDG